MELKKLFGSGSRVEILRILYKDETKERYGRELAKMSGACVHAIARELKNLEQLGIIKPRLGRRCKVLYRLNTDSRLYSALKLIIN